MDNLKILVMDVDGTLTDGKLHFSNSGELFKTFSVKDGVAIKKLYKNNIVPAIITGRYSKIVKLRALELGISEIYQKITNKLEVINTLCIKYNAKLENVGFIGDDLNDLHALTKVGFKFTVNDAAKEIKVIADYISPKNGGDGAVRDIIDNYLRL